MRVTGSSAAPVGSTGGNVTSFTVTGLTASTAYTFDVQALDAAGDISQPSNQVTVTTDASGTTTANIALGKPVTASSQTQVYFPANTTDGSADTYWESANNVFPQWIQVDLGAATATVKRLVLKLPPAAAWATRTQTVSVLTGSTSPTDIRVSNAPLTFNPSTGNTVTVTLPAAITARYVRLNFTANTGWPAAQLSDLQIYSV
jgi:chitodextrinase